MIPAIAIGAYGIGCLIASFLGARQQWGKVAILVVAIGAVFLACFFVPRTYTGYADIAFATVAFLICVPAGAGVLSGAIIGWLILRVRGLGAG